MLAARVTAARALVYQTAARDAHGEEVVREVSMLKALCGELVNDVMYDCLQFHGGAGYLRGMAIERMARDAVCRPLAAGRPRSCLRKWQSGSDRPLQKGKARREGGPFEDLGSVAGLSRATGGG